MKKKHQQNITNQTEEAGKPSDPRDQKIAELTNDLQRLRADFENYRKRVDDEKLAMKQYGEEAMIKKFLPVLDTIDRALNNFPEELADNAWAQGIQSLAKNLIKTESEIGLKRISASPGTLFDHNLHHAVAVDDSEGDHEVVAEELQPGYTLNGTTLREASVRVGRE